MTDDEYTALLDQAAAAYRRVRPWVRAEEAAKWYGMVATSDEAGNVTGRGILIQNQPPEDFGTFMTSWMKARLAPPLRWIATRFNDAPPVDPERDGLLIDEGFSVGRVRYEEPMFDPSVPPWKWSMDARGKRRLDFVTEGRVSTKEAAKAEVERAYARLCEDPTERQVCLDTRRGAKAAADAWNARHRPNRKAAGNPKVTGGWRGSSSA